MILIEFKTLPQLSKNDCLVQFVLSFYSLEIGWLRKNLTPSPIRFRRVRLWIRLRNLFMDKPFYIRFRSEKNPKFTEIWKF